MVNLTKSKNARGFLFLMLSIVILFISIVCLVINNRNSKIISGATIGETDEVQEYQSTEEANDIIEPDTEKSEAKAPETTITPETTKQQVTAVAAGTINNPTVITIDEANWNLTLVNSGYRIPDSYNPDLVYVCGTSERLDSKVAKHYEKMFEAAQKDGVYLTPCSGYRSYDLQERNYNNKIAYYESLGYSKEDAAVKAATIIMPPGSSEHNLGYAMDIVCVDEWFEDTDEFQWLMENAADYGFILRYPKDKQDITKVTYEPWHWRYVGVEAAKEIKASGQVLEEYLKAN
ncbi:MAG: D-alanyl-D-alanine carboxypeptidase family protein [Ruminococcaceae bacterium]|nr:D-alanyl-D-alanine carboxypeptidase family protein [Oscillospiraceae bacterium]